MGGTEQDNTIARGSVVALLAHSLAWFGVALLLPWTEGEETDVLRTLFVGVLFLAKRILLFLALAGLVWVYLRQRALSPWFLVGAIALAADNLFLASGFEGTTGFAIRLILSVGSWCAYVAILQAFGVLSHQTKLLASLAVLSGILPVTALQLGAQAPLVFEMLAWLDPVSALASMATFAMCWSRGTPRLQRLDLTGVEDQEARLLDAEDRIAGERESGLGASADVKKLGSGEL